jgi:hypothetical protein
LRRRIKVTVASIPAADQRPQELYVRDHVKQAWEKIKIDLTSDDDGDDQMQDDDDVDMRCFDHESGRGNFGDLSYNFSKTIMLIHY